MPTRTRTGVFHSGRSAGVFYADVKNSTIGFKENFDADVKKRTARHPMTAILLVTSCGGSNHRVKVKLDLRHPRLFARRERGTHL